MKRRHSLIPCLFLLAAASASSQQSKPRAAVSPAAAADFVRRSCSSTSYPRVCERSLLPRAPDVGHSPRRLAKAALAVAADRARSCAAYIGHPSSSSSGGGAMGDCAETVRDAAEQLRQSAVELGGRNMGRASSPRFAWRLSNVQTWASAAVTDADTCLDSLATYAGGGGGAGGADVRRRVVAVAQATSNALVLVNQLQPAPHHQ